MPDLTPEQKNMMHLGLMCTLICNDPLMEIMCPEGHYDFGIYRDQQEGVLHVMPVEQVRQVTGKEPKSLHSFNSPSYPRALMSYAEEVLKKKGIPYTDLHVHYYVLAPDLQKPIQWKRP